ncbi:multicopper oxidase family protein [Zhihengliuella salsuginis]|uniref:Multicopper oxidase CueO n=1 Tax=Zhihengliuella salsuginis TaxID=578222 RepID=A0ABQ3GG97_9MICC|nr:multicopper oxidase domain-containing protein [Zhihengliuella salsuginis]GHD05066.1 multicopper oxidase [Zhihengliuella salsuginis]
MSDFHRPSRRAVLGGLTSLGLLALTGSLAGCGRQNEVQLPAAPTAALPIPPLADSRVEDGVRVFDLAARPGTMDLLPGFPTPTAGFNGPFLGPTLRASRGERVRVRVANELDEATSVHWHGMHLPPEMDGGPHQPVAAGDTWEPEWLIDQPAATLWYHPHPHGETQRHVNLGLAGLFVVDDQDTPAGLPGEYGVDDVPVIVQDKMVGEEGGFLLDTSGNEIGILGSTLLVNGARNPFFEVSSQRVRLRLLNASTARTYNFGFADSREFALIASDGGLLASPVPLASIRLSPAERAEIVVEMAPGETIMLRSGRVELGAVAVPAAFGGEDEFDVLELRAAGELAPSPPVPGTLARIERLRVEDAAGLRDFRLADRKINSKEMDMGRIDEVVRVGSTEVWEVRNTNPYPHNFHVHDVQFQVVSIDGQDPPPELGGLKDTIYLEPRRVYRIIMRFEDYTSAKVPYMYHCHLLLHEDEGMMGQFVVLEDGEPVPAGIPATDH